MRSFAWRALALLAISAALLLLGSAGVSVFDRDEARFALAVREMRTSGELVVPTNFGEPRYHKPILAYWLALGAERLLGPCEFAWRLPSAMAGLITLGATLALARRRYGERVALRAAAILGTSLVFVVEARILTADALLLATTTLAFWAWSELRTGRGARLGWQLLFWSAVALGILAKGVNIAFLAAAGVALSWLRMLREQGSARRARQLSFVLLAASLAAALPGVGVLGPVLFALAATAVLLCAPPDPERAPLGATWGVPLCAALVAVWLLPALVRTHGSFLREGVGHHLLERAASPFEGHRGFPGYYLLTGVLAFFPWSAWLPATLRGAWREPSSDFFLAWILGPWALLECLASKLPHYPLVCLPALAIVLARAWPGSGSGRRALESVLSGLPCALLALGGIVLGLRLDGRIRSWAFLVSAWAFGLGLVLLTHALRRNRPSLMLVWVGAAGLYLLLALGLLPAYEARRLPKPLGAEVARLARPGEVIHLVRYRPASLGCYLPDGHVVVQDPDAVENAIAQGSPGLYLVPGDKQDARFADANPDGTQVWERLANVHGLDGITERELWIVRRDGRKSRPR